MVNIKKQLVSEALASKVTYKVKNSRKVIVIHETANTSKGADAQAHANLQSKGNPRAASWHYQVDEKEVIQSFDHSKSCYAAGYTANTTGIHIEICVNSDGNFKKAVANAAELVKKIMKDENIPIGNVRQHNFYTGKNCPTNLRNGAKGITWADFINQVKGATPAKETPKAPAKSDVSQIRILVEKLNYYDSQRWTNPAGTVNKGEVYTVAGVVKTDGVDQYKLISGTYITTNPKYVEPVKKAVAASKPKETLVQILVDKLNYYSTPRWTNPSGIVKKNEVFTVIKKVKVDNGEQYQLKSGTYITANPKYVKVL